MQRHYNVYLKGTLLLLLFILTVANAGASESIIKIIANPTDSNNKIIYTRGVFHYCSGYGYFLLLDEFSHFNHVHENGVAITIDNSFSEFISGFKGFPSELNGRVIDFGARFSCMNESCNPIIAAEVYKFSELYIKDFE